MVEPASSVLQSMAKVMIRFFLLHLLASSEAEDVVYLNMFNQFYILHASDASFSRNWWINNSPFDSRDDVHTERSICIFSIT